MPFTPYSPPPPTLAKLPDVSVSGANDAARLVYDATAEEWVPSLSATGRSGSVLADIWTQLTPPSALDACQPSVVVMSDELVYVAPINTSGSSTVVTRAFWKFNPTTRVWTQLADVPVTGTIRMNPITKAGGTVCVGPIGDTDECYLYDPATDSWGTAFSVASGPAAVADGVTVGGRAYLGYSSSGIFGRIDPLDPTEWVDLTEPTNNPSRPYTSQPIAVGAYIYLFGSLDASNDATADAWRYDTVSDEWEQLPNLPAARTHVAGCHVPGTSLIYLIGGADQASSSGVTYYATAWTYNIETGDYEPISDAPTQMARAAAFYAAGRVHVLGGKVSAGSQFHVYG